jgi:hypothetical protein
MRFIQWLEEKKKSSKESMPTTAVSSPIRGANQDQSGFGVKKNVSDYTISDEKINELISGVGAQRNTPVNITSTPRSKSSNAPASSSALQHSADQRRVALDKQGEQQKVDQKKEQDRQLLARVKQATANKQKAPQ